MKKAVTVIICIGVVSLFALTFLQAQSRSLNTQPKEDSSGVSEQIAKAVGQSPDPNIEQTSQPGVTGDKSTVDNSCKNQAQQTLNANEFNELTNDTNSNQTAGLAAPFPDGRIFLTPQAEPGDAIPYIPTQSPKTTSRMPITPLEPDA